MAIEIYDKAKVIKKDGTFYFFVKWGSKNCFTCPGQTVYDDNFHRKFLSREVRDSDWYCVAKGKEQATILKSSWNCPTSSVYGVIRFGNGKNIASYLAKTAAVPYETLDSVQQGAVDGFISTLEDHIAKAEWLGGNIDLDAMKPEQEMKIVHGYCGTDFKIVDHLKNVLGYPAWDLNNL
jgi:hypothetical protein